MDKKLLSSNKNIRRTLTFQVKSVDEVNHIVEGEFSHQIEDRQGEVVMQSGWDLTNYRLNPVVLWAHQHDQLPIAKMLEIGVNEQNVLVGKMQFAVDEYLFSATVFNLIKGGYQRAFSVAFNNNKYEVVQGSDIVTLLENELYEISCVPVGADQLALAKSKGIDTAPIEEPQKIVPEEAVEIISKSSLETIRSAIRTLTEVLNAGSKADNQVGDKGRIPLNEGGIKKISVNVINRAMKELLKIKNSQ